MSKLDLIKFRKSIIEFPVLQRRVPPLLEFSSFKLFYINYLKFKVSNISYK